MRRYYLLMSVLFTVSILNAQQWMNVSRPYAAKTFNDIYFISETEGWAAGDDGYIMHTSDAGLTWEAQTSGTDKSISKIFFLDANNGWAGAGSNTALALPGGILLKTTDGGKNWSQIDFSSAVPNTVFTFFDNILFLNAQVGFMVAGKSKSNYLLKTTDGGLTWVKKDSLVATSALRWYDMDFFNESKGVIVGTAKNIQKYTTDGGETWNFSTAIVDGFFKDIRAVEFLSETEVIAVGDGHEYSGVPTPVYKSSDGGINWVKKTQSPINSYGKTRGMYFKNNLEGIVVGNDGYSLPHIYRTTDGGETWALQAANSVTPYASIAGIGNTLYVLGYSSEILKSTDFGVTFSNYSAITPSPVMDIDFVGNRGYAVHIYGTVQGSSDENNESWSYINKLGKYTPRVIEFIDENTGFVMHENRFIEKTTDGGLTWNTVLEPLTRDSKYSTVGFKFMDASTGFALMNDGVEATTPVFKTTDAGNTWAVSSTLTGQLEGGLYFFDQNTGFVAGDNDKVNITTDGGTTWNNITVNNVPLDYLGNDSEEAAIVNDNTAFIVGPNIIFKTTDRGNTWNYTTIPDMGEDSVFVSISFYDESLGYICESGGVIYKTTDGGNTWEKDITYKDKYVIFTSQFNNKGELFFGTSNGNIVKWKSSSVDVEDNDVKINSYSLEQNYPNPFNPATTISFKIAEQGFVILKVYDILGREAATVINEELPAGSHSVNFNASELTSGIYFYTLKSGNFSSTQKMVLIK